MPVGGRKGFVLREEINTRNVCETRCINIGAQGRIFGIAENAVDGIFFINIQINPRRVCRAIFIKTGVEGVTGCVQIIAAREITGGRQS